MSEFRHLLHQVFNSFLLCIFLQVSQFSQVSLVKFFRGLCQPFREKLFLSESSRDSVAFGFRTT